MGERDVFLACRACTIKRWNYAISRSQMNCSPDNVLFWYSQEVCRLSRLGTLLSAFAFRSSPLVLPSFSENLFVHTYYVFPNIPTASLLSSLTLIFANTLKLSESGRMLFFLSFFHRIECKLVWLAVSVQCMRAFRRRSKEPAFGGASIDWLSFGLGQLDCHSCERPYPLHHACTYEGLT